MVDVIDKELKEGDGMSCSQCGKTIIGDAFSVIHMSGSFAVDVDGEEEITKIYLCSSECRQLHVGGFWRHVFPCS